MLVDDTFDGAKEESTHKKTVVGVDGTYAGVRAPGMTARAGNKYPGMH